MKSGSIAVPRTEAKPKISVGMPVFNGEPYLEEAISSITAQTFDDFELIISDNASTDRTREICQDLANQDRRIRYTRNHHNIGAAKNYNTVFKLARGEFFRWANSDDRSLPHLHRECLNALEADDEIVLACGKTTLIDEHGDSLGDYEDNMGLCDASPSVRFIDFITKTGLTNAIYGLMRSEAVRRTSLFGNGSLPAADIIFMAELTLQGKFVEVPEVLFCRRLHAGASSSERDNDAVQAKFWSGENNRFWFPQCRTYLAHIRSVWNAKISNRDRIRLLRYMAKCIYWDRHKIGRDFVRASTVPLSTSK